MQTVETTKSSPNSTNAVLAVRDLKDVAHFFIGNDVRIFNTVTGEWSNWRKMSFTDCNLIVNHNAKAQLKLIDITTIDYDIYKEVDNLQGNTEIGSHKGHVYSCPEKVRRYFLTTYAEKTLEACKRGYDVFGLLGTNYAVSA